MMKEYEIKARSWLSDQFDEQTRKEVEELIEKGGDALEDAFYRNLEFGTGGLRGKMGAGTNRMNRYTVGMATQGLASYILKASKGKRPNVSISFDSRLHSREFAGLAAEVLSANGIDVFLFDDIRPTPELSFAIRLNASIAGIMITASHNPKQYNGYKVFWSDGAQITSPVDKEIIEQVRRVTSPSMVRLSDEGNPGKITLMGKAVDEKYLEAILSLNLSDELCRKHSDIRFVYTPLHGCGAALVPQVLERMGFTNVFPVEEQMIPDGNFPTVSSPNPEEPSAMVMAIDKAEEVGADIVIATDPDADRMGIAVRNSEGKMVRFNGNQTASLLTYYILKRRQELGLLHEGQYVVKTIVTTPLVAKIAQSFAIPSYDVLTGFKYIARVVREKEGKEEFLCGAEESFGFNSGEFVRDKDAQNAAATLAQAAAWAAERGKTVFELMEEIYSEYGYFEESLSYLVKEGPDGAREILSLMEAFRSNPPKTICGSKVVRVIDYLQSEKTGLPSSNVLQFFDEAGDVVSVRPSGTEPKIKFYFAASGSDAHERVMALTGEFIG